MPSITSLQPMARELRRRIRAGGLRGAIAFVATGVRAQLSKRETLLVLVKPLDAIAVPVRRGNVRIEALAAHHLPALRELNGERGDIEGDARFTADIDAGYAGFVGFDGEQLISCYWWADGTMPPHRDMHRLGLGIELTAGDVYGYDLYVDKRYRAGGTVNDFLYQIETALHERGFARLWGWVAAENRTARWTYNARGYLPIHTVERRRILRRWRNRIVALEREREGTDV